MLTSNRDEKSFRPTDAPKIYPAGEKNICFPKDSKAGGSWIATNDKGRICCLLNGAFVAHQKKTQYLQSRGTVLIDLASSDLNPEVYFQEKDLKDIEPFTIVTVEIQEDKHIQLSEFKWDGSTKYFRQLKPNEPYVWSSVTLYSPEQRELRNQWFDRFLKMNNGNISPENIIEFHSGIHTSDSSINLVMEREGDLKTVSITQVIPEEGKIAMRYFDLHNHFNTEIKL